MKKPNLNTIIADNLNKTAHIPSKGMAGLPNKKATVPFVSGQGYKNGLPPAGSHYRIPSDTLYNPTPYRIKATPNNGPSKWLEAYDTSGTQFPGADYVDEQHFQNGGTYISDRAKATQFGQYAKGGSSWMLTNPNRISTFFPRMANGGGLLSRTVTCSSCGHSWKAVDGGEDVMTCHKCGGMIKMQNGGDPSIPDLNEYQIGGWLDAAINTGKKYVNKIGNAITHTDPVNFFPFGNYMPANAKAFTRFAAANVGLGKGVPFIKKEDLTPEQIKVIKQAALNAQKRTGQAKGGIKYSDYGKGKGQVWNNKTALLTDPTKVAQTSIGRFTYGVNPNNSVNVSDKYDFNRSSTLNDQGMIGNMIHRFVDVLDSRIPANDSRRNVNFDLYETGGPIKKGKVTTKTTKPPKGIVDTFLDNVSKVKKIFSSDSDEKPKETIKAVAQLKKDYVSKYGKDYVDLMEAYGLDPFSEEGILKAQEISKGNPNTRIVCTAKGCSEIAVNAANAFGYDFNRGNAWDLGNTNKVVATNPAYATQIGKGILTNPTSYTAPKNMFQAGAIISLNRNNTSEDNVRATTTLGANDSWDYANQTLYPKSRGNEHVGYMIDPNTMLHGTAGHNGSPAYYMIDNDMSNGVSLPGNLKYQPVETIVPGSKVAAASKGVVDTVKSWFNEEGGETSYEDGGWLSQYANKKQLNKYVKGKAHTLPVQRTGGWLDSHL